MEADSIFCSSEGYLILGSGMAVHSFASISEIHQAGQGEGSGVRKVLAESRKFDTELRDAVTKQHASERRQALLALESLHEFRRSHPTVEVRVITAQYPEAFISKLSRPPTNLLISILHRFWWQLVRQGIQMSSLLAKMLSNPACHT